MEGNEDKVDVLEFVHYYCDHFRIDFYPGPALYTRAPYIQNICIIQNNCFVKPVFC